MEENNEIGAHCLTVLPDFTDKKHSKFYMGLYNRYLRNLNRRLMKRWSIRIPFISDDQVVLARVDRKNLVTMDGRLCTVGLEDYLRLANRIHETPGQSGIVAVLTDSDGVNRDNVGVDAQNLRNMVQVSFSPNARTEGRTLTCFDHPDQIIKAVMDNGPKLRKNHTVELLPWLVDTYGTHTIGVVSSYHGVLPFPVIPSVRDRAHSEFYLRCFEEYVSDMGVLAPHPDGSGGVAFTHDYRSSFTIDGLPDVHVIIDAISADRFLRMCSFIVVMSDVYDPALLRDVQARTGAKVVEVCFSPREGDDEGIFESSTSLEDLLVIKRWAFREWDDSLYTHN